MQASAEINVALQLAKSITKSLPKAIRDGMLGKAEKQLARARAKGLTAQEQIDHDHVLELLGTLRSPTTLGAFSPNWGLGAKLLLAGFVACLLMPKSKKS
jgi:hypothetical protein